MMSTVQAAWVIARRDYAAIVFSKSFLLFLLGPLFPLAIGLGSGALGGSMAESAMADRMAVAMTAPERQALARAADGALASVNIPDMVAAPPDARPADLLTDPNQKILLVLSGSLRHPVLTGTAEDIADRGERLALLVGAARAGGALAPAPLDVRAVTDSRGAEQRARVLTGQAGQVLLFLVITLLAGMVLSNLAEEKSNKIIEVLAAAVPVDAIFVGKLFAMLAMALTGLAVWGVVIVIGLQIWGGALPPLPAPAVGWVAFVALAMVYFATAYLLLGAIYVGIGAQASTVREIQTLSMPVTMGQLVVFFLAAYTVDKVGEPLWWAAVLFPFSSPMAMLAVAAQDDRAWPHLLAIAGQLVVVVGVLKLGAALFRRHVLKSGPGGRRWFGAARRPTTPNAIDTAVS